ncbi:MAG: hypothetical protein NZ551_06955 [Microscillaceae bacterium]|nr:hypothetical protein [Microscillaceae bacterium]MDW8460931.1 hypothetical protein [Cytophagales bacterium]
MQLYQKRASLLLGFSFCFAVLAFTYQTDRTKLLIRKWKLIDAEFPEIEAELLHFSPSQRKAHKQELSRTWVGSFIEFRKDNTYTAVILADTAQGIWHLSTDQSQLLIKNQKDSIERAMPILELSKNRLILIGTQQQKMIWQPF